MKANQILEELRPLLVSSKLGDLLKAKDELFLIKDSFDGEDRIIIADELSRLQRSIEIAMNIDYSNLPIVEDDGIPTLNSKGEWSNIEK